MFAYLQAVPASGGFNPATLSLTGWWRGSFASSPWNGTASAGSSGTRTLTEATNPPDPGTLLNGFAPADFSSSDRLGGLAISNYFTTAAGSALILYRADTSAAPAADPINDPALIGQSGSQQVQIAHNSTGPVVSVHDSASQKRIQLTAATGSWHLVQMRWNGTNMQGRVDSNSWSTSAATAGPSPLTTVLRVGANYNLTKFFDGQIMSIIFDDTTLDDATFDNIKSSLNTRYALSL